MPGYLLGKASTHGVAKFESRAHGTDVHTARVREKQRVGTARVLVATDAMGWMQGAMGGRITNRACELHRQARVDAMGGRITNRACELHRQARVEACRHPQS